MPAVLDLVQAGRIDPALVTQAVLPWDAAPKAMFDSTLKPVFVRD